LPEILLWHAAGGDYNALARAIDLLHFLLACFKDWSMECYICARAIPKGQVVHDTKDERIDAPDHGGGSSKTMQIALCPACARRRNRREVYFWIAVISVVAAGMLGLVFAMLSRNSN
jgi:hypothetical protein